MNYSSELVHQIAEEARRLYKERYGRRNPNTLSTLELDDIKTKAAQVIMKRRGKK